MELCNECGREFKDKSGLAGHVRQIHGTGVAPGSILTALRSEVATLRQAVEGLTQSTQSSEGVQGADSALTAKDLRIHELKTKLAAKDGVEADLAAAQAELAAAQARVSELEATATEKPESTYPPPSQDLMDHWLSCQNCRPLFDELSRQWQENYNRAFAADLKGSNKYEVAKRYGIELAPEHIILKGFKVAGDGGDKSAKLNQRASYHFGD